MDYPTEPGRTAGSPPLLRVFILAALFLAVIASAVRACEAPADDASADQAQAETQATPKKPPPKPEFADLERQVFELVNADRKANKKKVFYEYDEALADVARAHSADMLKNSFFAHESPRTGNVGDRLFAARVRVMSCAENIAMNASIKEAETRLMDSVAHRKNILHDKFTRCGIGIVRASGGLYYITQVFAAPPPEVDVEKIGTEMLDRLNKARAADGRAPLGSDAVLSRVAAQRAAAVAEMGKVDAVDIGALAEAAGLPHARLATAYVCTWNPEELVGAEELINANGGRIGFGFAVNTKHKKLGYGIIWAVVIFADK